jgi:hypothetical protein
MSTISSGTTLTTGYVVTSDTTGTLVFQVNGTTTAATLSATGNLTLNTGNLTFGGTAQRITGDFSNATPVNRPMFQSSTTNGYTVVRAIPNGTSQYAEIGLGNNSDATAATSTFFMSLSATEARIASSQANTGTLLPLTFQVGGSERVRIDTSGNVGIGKTPTAGRLLDVNGDAWLNGVRVGRGAGSVSTNTAVGSNALTANTSGTVNTAVGEGALASNTTGSGNNAFGRNALTGNTTGYGNVAVGSNDAGTLAPMQLNTTGYYNVAIGNGALYANTSGFENTALGRSSLLNNTTGSYNTAVGVVALGLNTTGVLNTATGYAASLYQTTANYNSAHGAYSLHYCTTGSANTASGYYSLLSCTTGGNNTAMGYYAGYGITTGTANVLLGQQAGYQSAGLTTGVGNICLGAYSDVAASANNYEIVIGYNTQGKGSSTGFINPNGGGVYQGNNSSSWSTTSDRRLKKNIVDNNDGLAKINQLRVRNFEYRTKDEIDPELPKSAAIEVGGVQLGVIAQEIREVLPECVKEESTGVLSVNSDRLIWHLVNAVKELSAEVNALKAKLGE